MLQSSSRAALAAALLALALVPATAAAEPGKLAASASLHILPVGSFKYDIPGFGEGSESTDLAYGIGGQIDYQVAPAISIGFAPRYILNVITSEADDDADAASELDLMFRGQYLSQLNPRTAAYGFGALGYSMIMPPSSADDDEESAKGFAIGFGGGVRHALSGTMFFQGELGYQIGMQEITEGDLSAEIATNYLHLSVGVGSHF
jgi:hypothetical protein